MEDILLSSNGFGTTMKKTFSSLVNDTNFADVTLACSDAKQIKAHKVILGGSSPFFRAILLNNPHQHPLIYLKGVESTDLKAVLQFIYLGQTRILKEQVESFLEAARELQVEGLAEQKKEKIPEVVDKGNIRDKTNLDENKVAYNIPFEPKMNGQESEPWLLSKHNSTNDTDINTNYKCDICGFESNSKTDKNRKFILKEHKKRHHLETFTKQEQLHGVVNDVKELFEENVDNDSAEVNHESGRDNSNEKEGNCEDIYSDESKPSDTENHCNLCGFITSTKGKSAIKFVLRRHKEKSHPENPEHMETVIKEDTSNTENHKETLNINTLSYKQELSGTEENRKPYTEHDGIHLEQSDFNPESFSETDETENSIYDHEGLKATDNLMEEHMEDVTDANLETSMDVEDTMDLINTDDEAFRSNENTCNICGYVTNSKSMKDMKSVIRRHKIRKHPEEHVV